MTNANIIAENYLALWNDAEDKSRRMRLEENWTADSRYSDPLMAGVGREEIAAMITSARDQFPGHTFTLRGTPDAHGRFVRFSWTLASGDGVAVAGGTDIVRLDVMGRIAEVIGFLDSTEA